MPFKSEKHEGYMWHNHPEIARRWTRKYGSFGSNPQKAGLRRKHNKRRDSARCKAADNLLRARTKRYRRRT